MTLRDLISPEQRREFLEKLKKIHLNNIGKTLMDKNDPIHCENLIGGTILPMGVAGPLKILNFKFQISNYYIPLATTEGALVASVNRGCKAINFSGGTTTAVELVGTTRGPVFETAGIKESLKFRDWLDNNFSFLKKGAEKTSSHIKLMKLGTRTNGRYVYVRFYFDTSKAMGMNMVTIATQKIVETIEKAAKIKCLSLAGNFDIDKKPTWLNFIFGRGRRVWAEAIIPEKIVNEVLKTTPSRLYDVWLAKCLIGSAMSGSLGFNAHYTNVIAAFFAATGQDLAHVVEGSLGMTTTKILENGNLYISVYLPDVMIGIVGGGTKLIIKKEALSIIGAKSSSELAEVLAGAVLAGEISLLASLAEGSLAKTHDRLGR